MIYEFNYKAVFCALKLQTKRSMVASLFFCPVFVLDQNFDCRIDQCPHKSNQDGILPKNSREFVWNDVEKNATNCNDDKIVHEFSKILCSTHVNLPVSFSNFFFFKPACMINYFKSQRWNGRLEMNSVSLFTIHSSLFAFHVSHLTFHIAIQNKTESFAQSPTGTLCRISAPDCQTSNNSSSADTIL